MKPDAYVAAQTAIPRKPAPGHGARPGGLVGYPEAIQKLPSGRLSLKSRPDEVPASDIIPATCDCASTVSIAARPLQNSLKVYGACFLERAYAGGTSGGGSAGQPVEIAERRSESWLLLGGAGWRARFVMATYGPASFTHPAISPQRTENGDGDERNKSRYPMTANRSEASMPRD